MARTRWTRAKRKEPMVEPVVEQAPSVAIVVREPAPEMTVTDALETVGARVSRRRTGATMTEALDTVGARVTRRQTRATVTEKKTVADRRRSVKDKRGGSNSKSKANPSNSSRAKATESATVVETVATRVKQKRSGIHSKEKESDGEAEAYEEAQADEEAEAYEESEVDEEAQADEDDDCAVADDRDADEATDALEIEDDPFLAQTIQEFNEEFGWGADKRSGKGQESGSESDEDSGDDCWDEENIPDPLSSDDDDEEKQQERESQDPVAQIVLGKTFPSAQELKRTLLNYSIKTRFDIKYYKSTSVKVGAKCTSERKDPKKGLEPCPWRLYASYERRKRKLMIKVLVDKHTCCPSGRSKLLKRGTIAYLWTDRLRLDKKITAKHMAAEIQREYGLRVSELSCGKAKTLVMNTFKKTHTDHFAKIWGYQAEVFRTNPGSTMEIETVPGPTIGSLQRFYRVFICFSAQRETWRRSCRPIIGLDGAFLKWDIKGQLLAAVGRDGDNRIIPIAWAVVEIENETNWDWFVRLLSRELGLSDGRDIAMISDKQKVKAITLASLYYVHYKSFNVFTVLFAGIGESHT